jgi:tetratricopeptide (TPR) repeat protein
MTRCGKKTVKKINGHNVLDCLQRPPRKKSAKKITLLVTAALLSVSAFAGAYRISKASEDRFGISLQETIHLDRPLSDTTRMSLSDPKAENEGSAGLSEKRNTLSSVMEDALTAVETGEGIDASKAKNTAATLHAAVPSSKRLDHTAARLDITQAKGKAHRERPTPVPPQPNTAETMHCSSLKSLGDSTIADKLEKSKPPGESEEGNPFYGKALTYHRSGRLSDAVRIYQKVLEIDSDHEGATLNLAAAYIELGNFRQARVLLEKLESSPSRPRGVLLNLAISSIGTGDAKKAVAYLKRAQKESDASLYDIQFHKAVAYSRLDRLPEALTLYQQILEKRPDDTAVRFNLAVTCDTLGLYPKAMTHYEEVLQASSNIDKNDIHRRMQTIGRYLNTNQNTITRQ